MYCLFCVVLCIVCVYMCTVLLAPGGYPIAVKYIIYITSHHITSRHVTSHHITSHHIMSRHITSRHITSRHVTSHHITSRHVTSHHITSHHVTSHHITTSYNISYDIYHQTVSCNTVQLPHQRTVPLCAHWKLSETGNNMFRLRKSCYSFELEDVCQLGWFTRRVLYNIAHACIVSERRIQANSFC